MSSAGHVVAMITSLKNNMRRRKTSDTSMAGVEAGAMYKSGSKAPKFTAQQIAEAKRTIQKKAYTERRKQLHLLIIIIIASPILGYGIFKLLEFLIF